MAQYELTAIKHEPGKQAYVEEGLVIQPKITTALIPDILPSPTNLRIGANSRAGVNNSTAVVVAQWDESPNAEHYELQWRKDAGVYPGVTQATCVSTRTHFPAHMNSRSRQSTRARHRRLLSVRL